MSKLTFKDYLILARPENEEPPESLFWLVITGLAFLWFVFTLPWMFWILQEWSR